MSNATNDENLANAIVWQAAEDYAAAFMGNTVDKKAPEKMLRDCEKFFRSDWYRTLTNGAIDADWLMRNIKIRELEKAVKACTVILGICNDTTLRATVNFPKEQGKEKPKAKTYVFPPRLADALMDALRVQLESIKAEIAELEAENTEVRE